MHITHDAVRVLLPADIPQAEQDAPADRKHEHAASKGRFPDLPVAARRRIQLSGLYELIN